MSLEHLDPNTDTPTLLALMLNGFQKPITTIHLQDSFSGTSKRELKSFARTSIAQVLEATNTQLLQDLANNTTAEIRNSNEFSERNLALESSEPTFQDVQATLAIIYKMLNLCQTQREKVQHYTRVVKSAETYLKAFRNALSALFEDEDICPTEFDHLSQRQRLFEQIVTDLDTTATLLTQTRQDLTSIYEDVISPRNQLLLRAESSIRLLTNFQRNDNLGNFAQSRPNTRSPRENAPPDLSGFAITD